MREYVYSTVLVAVALGIVFILSPGGRGLSKHIRLIASVCFLTVLIYPATSLIDSLRQMGDYVINDITQKEEELYDKYKSIYESYLDGAYGDNVGKAVKDVLKEKFDIENEECRVSTEFYYSDKEGVKIPRRITVVLSGKAKFKEPLTIKNFVSELFGCEVNVAVE